ncbi:MAG TPA: collagen-like protein [Polyangiaceae bacterium]|nr:collagen-like protein [Polyangiaceae bacterium]
MVEIPPSPMESSIVRGGLCLIYAACVAFGCSGKERQFRGTNHDADAGQSSDAGGSRSTGGSSHGAGEEAGASSDAGQAGEFGDDGQAGAFGDGGQAGALGVAGQAGAPSSGGESGAPGAAGQPVVSGDCQPGESRSCKEGGALGPCGAGTQFCMVGATWSACSIKPAAVDTCEKGNDDNCDGIPNQGCKCINGETKQACGPCNDGTRVCTDGKADQYGACQGAVKNPTTYYLDVDGDGYGVSSTSISSCDPPGSGYVVQAGDCCDGGNLAVASKIHPGQQTYFTTPANECGITWNYDCSANDSIQLLVPSHLTSCSSPPNTCADGAQSNYDASSCGTLLWTNCVCNSIGGTGTCSVYCTGSQTQQGCH